MYSLSLACFEQFKWPWVHFLAVYILFWKCKWKRGRLSEREVVEPLSVQSLACLPLLFITTYKNKLVWNYHTHTHTHIINLPSFHVERIQAQKLSKIICIQKFINRTNMIIFNSTNKHTIFFTKILGLKNKSRTRLQSTNTRYSKCKLLEIINLFHIRRIMLLAYQYPIKLHSHWKSWQLNYWQGLMMN